jgi:hypothetical protein
MFANDIIVIESCLAADDRLAICRLAERSFTPVAEFSNLR